MISWGLLQQASGALSCVNSRQCLMCLTSGCCWECSSPSKISGMYLHTSVAPSGPSTDEHDKWKHMMCQTMITKIAIIQSESSGKWILEHCPNFSLSCDLNSLLAFCRVICQWIQYNCTYKHHFPYLALMICHSSLTFWLFICWWIPCWFFSSEKNLWNLFILIFCNTWGTNIKITYNNT